MSEKGRELREGTVGSDGFATYFLSAKKHCLVSLLDFADAMQKGASKETIAVLESMKKRIHNDVGQYAQGIWVLVELARNGGNIKPFGG
jgi:hypothetical protein